MNIEPLDIKKIELIILDAIKITEMKIPPTESLIKQEVNLANLVETLETYIEKRFVEIDGQQPVNATEATLKRAERNATIDERKLLRWAKKIYSLIKRILWHDLK
jgi:hypothetical protein